MLGWLTGGIGKGVAVVVDSIGDAVQKNVRTIKGDVAEKEQHAHEEYNAALAQFAAEFANRPPKTWFDSLVDGLNRLPRPLIAFAVLGSIIYAVADPYAFSLRAGALSLVPPELWTIFMLVLGFFFSGRIISEDLKRPLHTEEQKRALAILAAKALAAERAAAAAAAAASAEERKEAAERAKSEPDVIVVIPPKKPVRSPDALPELPEDVSTPDAVDRMISDLVQREGGYVNNPADRGGPTKYGITLATLSDWREKPCTPADVEGMPLQEAVKIYRANYYLLPGIDTLPYALQSHVFDISVNSGPRAAIKMLQQVLNRKMGEALQVDGIIGPATRDACFRHEPVDVSNELVEARLEFYHSLVENDSTQSVFLNGWEKRAKSFYAKV